MTTIHNAIKRAGNLLSSFGNLVGLGEEEEGTVRLGESLTPILNVWELPEAALLRDEKIWGGQSSFALVALELGFVGVRNPSTSKRLTVVEGFAMHSTEAATGGLHLEVHVAMGLQSSSDVDSVTGVHELDARDPGFLVSANTDNPVIIAGTSAAGMIGLVQPLTLSGPGTTSIHSPRKWAAVLHPGSELRVYNQNDGQNIAGSFWGRYRNFKPSEPGQPGRS